MVSTRAEALGVDLREARAVRALDELLGPGGLLRRLPTGRRWRAFLAATSNFCALASLRLVGPFLLLELTHPS